MKFRFEDGLDCINPALQEVKAMIFRIPRDPSNLIQPNWTTQLSHEMEFHNVIIEEEDEDPRKNNILETEGHH